MFFIAIIILQIYWLFLLMHTKNVIIKLLLN